MYFWKYILAKKAGLSQKKCNMALYGLPVLPIAEAFEKTVTGNPISVTDALAQDALSLQVAFTPTQDGTPSIDSEPTTEPYLSKVVPRGNKEYYSLVGGTVARNQLVDKSKFATYTADGGNVVVTPNNDGSITVVINNDLSNKVDIYFTANTGTSFIKIPPNHVFALCDFVNSRHGDFRNGINYANLGWNRLRKVSSEYTIYLGFTIDATTTAGTYTITPQIIDLTLLFANNPAIADYAYSLEQSEAGSGIAWLKSYGFFTKDYYAYNPGELTSVNTSGHKIGSTTYPIDNIDLRGLFKLDSANKLTCEGDIYPPSGSVTRKYGIVDLGALNWIKSTYSFLSSDVMCPTSSYFVGFICSKYETVISSITYANQPDRSIKKGNADNKISIKDSTYTDAATFKAAMSGVYLVYELATPTTESATPYTSPIVVEQGGTEEFIDNRTVPIPVGNETYYASEYEVHGKTGITVSHSATSSDTPTEYEVEFTSQGTVYGGTVNIVSGVLSVTWAILSNPQNLYWITNSSQGMKNFQTDRGTVSKKSGSNNWKCSRYSNGFIGTDKAEGIFIFDSGEVCIRDYRYWEHGGTSAEKAAFKASLADVTIAYELATPQTYNLTPEQVTMLLGDNYLETEDGTITLTYMAGK